MPGYKRTVTNKEQIKLGKTKKLVDLGYSSEEIAESLLEPVEKVLEWVALIKKAEENRKT